jgi:tetratricopeptide (TPR) repeat protein
MARIVPVIILVSAILMSCGGGKLEEEEPQAELPEGHPPVGGSGRPMGQALGSDAPTDDNPLPLKLTGLNSVEEMERSRKGTENADAQALFEQGFRKTYTADGSKRDYPGAVVDLDKAIGLDPEFAEAYRALGYAKFNMGFDVNAAMVNYQKAVELDPEYGEAHYALAFLYAMGDRGKGAEHFRKAMELGVPDESNLKERFYGDN